jgi:hypothetical protein
MHLNRKTLDEETRLKFEELLDKSVGDLKPEEKGFLKARADYMTETERKAHISIWKK